jgi:chromosome segregation ATPase
VQLENLESEKAKHNAKIKELRECILDTKELIEQNQETVEEKKKLNKKLETEIEKLMEGVRFLEGKVEAQQQEFQVHSSEANLFSYGSSNAQKFIETMREDYESKMSDLDREIYDLKSVSEEMQNKFNREFSKQLTEITAENQKLFEDSLEKVLDEQRKMYEQSIEDIHKMYPNRDSRIAELEQLFTNLEENLDTTQKNLDNLRKTNEELKESIKQEESTLDEMKRNPRKELNQKSKEIQNLKCNFLKNYI